MERGNVSTKSRWRLYLTIGTFAFLLILIYGLRDQIREAFQDLDRINVAVLLLIIPLKLVNYDAYARMYRNLFSLLDHKVRYASMFRLTSELNFVNYLLPSAGVSGISYFSVRARSYGLSSTKATLVQFTKLLLLFVSFQPLLVLGVLILAINHFANNLVLVIASSLITLLIVGTFLCIYVIESRERINNFLTFFTKALNGAIHLVRRRQPETISIEGAQIAFNDLHDSYKVYKKNWRHLKLPFFHTMMANVTEIATLYIVYIAFGEYVNVGAVILAYAVANFAGLISVLPGGIGIYETLMTAVLVATGVPAGVSVSVTIMFRLLTMLIQLPPGYYFYQKALHEGKALKV